MTNTNCSSFMKRVREPTTPTGMRLVAGDICVLKPWLTECGQVPCITQEFPCFLRNPNIHEHLLSAHVLHRMNTGHIPCYHISLGSILILSSYPRRGIYWRSWLRHCSTSRKVSGSIPNGVIGIFHWHNPSDRTMALGSTQPLTEMNTRYISWGVKVASA